MKTRVKMLVAAATLACALAPSSASACAACFGRSDSPMAKGMNAGIFALLILVGGVLTGAASFFVVLARRAAKAEQAEQQAAAVSSKAS